MSVRTDDAAEGTDLTPWYRQAWPWFLIALPATAVVGGLITAYLAARGFDGPVVADYYRQGLAINQQVMRAQVARELGLVARVDLAGFGAGDPVRVEIEARDAIPTSEELQLRLIHPGRPDADRSALLKRSAIDPDERRAVYQGTLTAPASANAGPVTWQVALEARDWRIDDSLTASRGGRFTLQAR